MATDFPAPPSALLTVSSFQCEACFIGLRAQRCVQTNSELLPFRISPNSPTHPTHPSTYSSVSPALSISHYKHFPVFTLIALPNQDSRSWSWRGSMVRVLAVLEDDWSSAPNAHIKQLTVNCNSSSRGSCCRKTACSFSRPPTLLK